MALHLTRAVSRKFFLAGRQLQEVTSSWFQRALTPPRPAPRPEAADAYSHLHKSGEMNHLGHYKCDLCGAEMRLSPVSTSPGETVMGPRYFWECSGCGAQDDTSFRICRCGRQSVLEKHGGSGRELPISLNAGGCTECERCVVCDGILAVGNLKWFYGRWTHFYPDTEFDRRTMQEYTVTRERSLFYGFHAHYSCAEKSPDSIAAALKSRVPEWYAQGMEKQQAEEADRLRHDHRCLVCKAPLDAASRILGRETHARCGKG